MKFFLFFQINKNRPRSNTEGSRNSRDNHNANNNNNNNSNSNVKKTSVIAVFKNNFLNRHSPSTTVTSTSTTTTTNSGTININTNLDNTFASISTPLSPTSPTTAIDSTTITNVYNNQLSSQQQTIVVNNQPTRNNCQTTSRIIDHQPLTSLSASSSVRRRSSAYSRDSGIISAPISPNSVIDPFSVDYTLYNACVRASVVNGGEQSSLINNQHHCYYSDINNNSGKHSSLSSSAATAAAAAAASTITTAATISPGSSLINRPRSRSSSASTMARVFDMFRGRSNSIATEQPQNSHMNNNNNYRIRPNNRPVSAKNFFSRFLFELVKKKIYVCGCLLIIPGHGTFGYYVFFLFQEFSILEKKRRPDSLKILC